MSGAGARVAAAERRSTPPRWYRGPALDRGEVDVLPDLRAATGHLGLAGWGGLTALAALVTAVGWAGPSGWSRARWALFAEAGPLPWRLADGWLTPALAATPLDALVVGPLAGLGAAWMPIGAGVWLALVGVATAWLAGAWWGRRDAAWVGGATGILLAAPVVADGDPAALAVRAILPLGLGALVRAAGSGRPLGFVAAGLAGAAVLALSDAATPSLLLAGAVVGAAGLRSRRPERALVAVAGAFGVALLVAAGPLAWRITGGDVPLPGEEDPPLALVVVAAACAWGARRAGGRVLVPVLLVLAGAGPTGGRSIGAVGGALLVAAAPGLLRQAIARRAPSGPTSNVGSGAPNT